MSYLTPIVLYYNMSTIALVYKLIIDPHTKHMELNLFFGKEKVLSKQLKAIILPDQSLNVDILTKALPPCRFENLLSEFIICDFVTMLNHSPCTLREGGWELLKELLM